MRNSQALQTVDRMSNQTCLQCIILFAAVGAASGSLATEPVAHQRAARSPLSPEEALQQFVVHPDLQVELVAAEPEVIGRKAEDEEEAEE